MKALLQRVKSAEVTIAGETAGAIGGGWLILLGIAIGDTEAEAAVLADKIAGLRLFSDSDGKFNLGVTDVGGQCLVVSQFTLYADCRKGRRPSFSEAAAPHIAEPLYEDFCGKLRAIGLKVNQGRFGADMQIQLINDGPVTVMLECRDKKLL